MISKNILGEYLCKENERTVQLDGNISWLAGHVFMLLTGARDWTKRDVYFVYSSKTNAQRLVLRNLSSFDAT